MHKGDKMIELTNASAGNEDDRTTPLWFQRRTRLEKRLLIVLVFVGTVLVGFLIDACTSSNDTDSTCSYTQCTLASSQIIKQVDQTVKPCEDFFQFACGKLKQRTHHRNVPSKMLHAKVQSMARNLLDEPFKENDHQAIKDEKKLFKACVTEQRNEVSLEILKSLFRELNGWPVLMGTEWKEEYFNWPETLIKLKAKGLRHAMLFDTYMNNRNTSYKIVEIIPTIAFHKDEAHLHVYNNYLRETAVIFGVNETDARREMGEVFQFVIHLDKINRAWYNSNESVSLSLSSFQARYPEVNWITYFDSMLSPNNITLEDYITILEPDYMDNFLEFMRNTSKRTIANYILWYSMTDIMPLASESFVEMHNQVACVQNFKKLQDAEECQTAMVKIFSPRPSYINYANEYFYKRMRRDVQNIFNRIFFEFKNELKLSSSLDDASYKNVSKWFDDLQLVIGTPENKVEKVFANYKSPTNMNEPFMKVFLEARRKKKMEPKDKRVNKYQFMHQVVQKTQIVYVRSEHLIMIPTGFLQGMYYQPQWPMYLNFAGLGKAIGAALSYQLFYTAALKLSYNNSEPWASQINNNTNTLSNCLWNNPESSEDPEGGFGTHYKQLKIAEINGIRLAYQAYRKWAEEEEDEALIGVRYSNEQLFWIWTFSNSCYDETDETEANFYTDNEVVRQNDHFANDFKCEPNSKMNPEKKCKIF